MKQALKTFFFAFPVAESTVVFGLVDQGEIMRHPSESAISAAGIAQELALGPTITSTLFWEMRRWAAAAA